MSPSRVQALLFAASEESAIDAALRARPDALVVDSYGCRIARDLVGRDAGAPRLWVPIAPLDGGDAEGEIAAALDAGADTLCLAGAVGRRDIEQLGAKLAVAEAEQALPDGRTGIVAVIDRATAVGGLSTIAAGGRGRLAGLAFDFAGIRNDLACGPDAAVVALALGSFILSAGIAGVPAVFLLNEAGDVAAAQALAAARSEGFTAVLAERPETVAAIRAAFRPGSGA